VFSPVFNVAINGDDMQEQANSCHKAIIETLGLHSLTTILPSCMTGGNVINGF